ncbi:MAG: ester cyclase [Alphaproteobacteria bacterium]|nr:ester cyclase [Alphaproteobacteria bacterium]
MSKNSLMVLLVTACVLGINAVEASGSSDTNPQNLEGIYKMTENNKVTLREFMEEVWNKGNLEIADKFVSFPYVIHHDPGDQWDGQSLDLETFKKRVLYSRETFPDLHFAVQEIVGEGDKVAISWYLEGTHKGDIPGLPATKKKVKVPGLTIYSFSKGKITGHWQVIDRLGFMQQVMPRPEGK